MERVGIYNRCSTEEESQRNALAAQVAESREIAEKKGWNIIEQYIESETGTVAYKRSEYQRLLADMEESRFDIVMIKSIDRLMRSAKDWYFFLSRLTENKLKLYIYIEGKFYSPDDNLISGIKAILAEDFSRELSKKIKNAHKRRQEKKSGLNITCEMFGWNKVKKDLYEINEEEASYYRTAFRLAGEGKGFYTISNTMYELGARTRSGQKISEVQWRKMLYAKRASGTMVLNTRTYNFDTKSYEKVPEEQWIYIENALPPIVSKEYQEEVLKVLAKRAAGGRDRYPEKMCHKGKYKLSHKLICEECQNYYYRAGTGKREGTVWKCSTFLKNGRTRDGKNRKGCDNPNIKEDQVIEWLKKELEVCKKKNDEEKIPVEKEKWLEEFMGIAGRVLKAQNNETEMEKLVREEKKLTVRKDKLMEKLLQGVVCDEEFRKYNGKIEEKLHTIKQKIDGIKQQDQQYNSYERRMKEIKETLCRQNLIETAAARTLLLYVDHIVVCRDGSLKVTFL